MPAAALASSAAATVLTLRRPRASDRELTRVWLTDPESNAWLGGYDSYWYADATDGLPNHQVFIAEKNGVPVAFAHLYGTPVAELCLCVDPSRRREGIGAAVLHAVADESVRVGVSQLRADVYAGNVASAALVRAAGFSFIGHDSEVDCDCFELTPVPAVQERINATV